LLTIFIIFTTFLRCIFKFYSLLFTSIFSSLKNGILIKLINFIQIFNFFFSFVSKYNSLNLILLLCLFIILFLFFYHIILFNRFDVFFNIKIIFLLIIIHHLLNQYLRHRLFQFGLKLILFQNVLSILNILIVR
jgi:hypothetical protein